MNRHLHIFLILFLCVAFGASAQKIPEKDAALMAKARQWQQATADGFIENKGQLNDQDGRPNTAVRYLLNMSGLNVQLRSTGFSYDTWVTEKDGDIARRKFHRVDIQLEGANPKAALTTEQPLADVNSVSNEHGFFGNIHSFHKVTYRNIYPGIDLEFVAKKGTDKPVEYNFIVYPGADASLIKMKYNSGSDISLKNGKIEMQLAFGTLREKIPLSYTQQDGQSLAVQYKPLDEMADIYAFNVPDYDRSKTLVIDPTPSLVWATYYGGSSAVDQLQSIDKDAAGNIYISGFTQSSNNIATSGTYQPSLAGTFSDMFLAKFTAAGVRLWGTYVGGTAGDGSHVSPVKVAVSGSAVYLASNATSSGLASASGVHQSTLVGISDAYLGKFNTADGTRIWATYYGGNDAEAIRDMSLDATGNIYLSGYTPSTSGIATAGALQQTYSGGGFDGYVAKFTPSGILSWGTYLGGAGDDMIYAVTANAAGDVFVSGNTTTTTGMTTPGAFQTTFTGGGTDIFLASINSTGTAKQWLTYWGGDGNEICTDLKIDLSGNLVAIGFTGSGANGNSGGLSNGLASSGALYATPRGGGLRDIVIAKFTASGSRLWSTYYGGTGADVSMNMELDENDNILFVGSGNMTTIGAVNNINGIPSPGLSTNCTYQPAIAGYNEAYITKLAADGSSVLWSTYFGGPDHDFAWAIKYLGSGNFMIGGSTRSLSGIATAGAHQVTNVANIVGAPGTSQSVCTGFFARFTEGLAPSDVQVTATTLNPMSQTSCALGIPATIIGNAVSLYNPPGFTSPIFYQWQVADAAAGPWTNLSGEIFKDLQPLASQTAKYYRRLILVNNGFCDKKTVDSSTVASVLINANVAPIANANGPQWFLCGAGANTVTLNGSATGGSGVYSTYQWYAGSNLATPVATTPAYTPTVTSNTTYTLKVTDNAGCIDVDQVTVVPAIANAGPDVSMCQGNGGVQIGTTGIPGGSVVYSWTPATGLSCTTCAQPIASPAATTTYQLTTTVTRKDGTTCSTTDNVTVTFVTAPTGGATFGGTDKTICKNTPVVLGGANDATVTYSWSPTSYLSASNIYNPTFNAGTNTVSCPMVYTVTAAKTGCAFTDQVNVTVIDASTSLDGQAVNCQSWSSGSTSNCSGATYSWQLVSGPGVVPTGTSLSGGGANAYLTNTGSTNAVYQRTTTINGVTCTSGPITIAPCGPSGGCPIISIQMLTPQGCPKVFGSQDLQLYVGGINAADYYFSWTPANIMDNPAAPSVNITSTAATTVNVTVTNKYTGQVCIAPGLPINNPAWSLPVLTTTDKNTCPATPVAIGEPAASGFSYNWSPATGLNLPNISNPIATLNTSAAYTVTKTDNSSGCKTTDNVAVNISEINFDAGPSHAICNGATVTLGTTPGGSYTYNWTPVGAAWTNGTGPTNANPQVLFAGSSQTFNVTITDPVSGCQKTDAVTLSGTITPGEYAGPAAGPLCPGQTAQLGTTAAPNASYSWSPATGLSCTTCANPTVTAGAASQTYSVTVSYPGCSTPVTDNVTVSLNALPSVTLIDKNVCPTTPTNIGIGGTGNTASLANVSSYLWSPASGLSCSNCASPNANPNAATTYNVVITFTNGCVINEDVVVTPTVQATAKPDATICPGSSVVLGSPAVPNVTYAWTVLSGTAGSITPTNIAQPTANPTATSVYRLTATGTGPNAGCTITDDATVTVKVLPAITVTGNTAVCTGGATILSVAPVTTNIIYQWSPLSGVVSPNSPSTEVMPSVTTLYRVTQTDLNSGCSDYKEVNVTVWPNNVTATGGTITVCPASQDTLPLTVSPASGNTISWSPATYLSNPYTQNPVVNPQGTMTYIATVTNNASSCSDTALVTVTVPATCTGSDYGDAPYGYENGDPASHGISPLIKIGTATDAEGGPVSALVNAPAIGDDGNNSINDEEGISFLPVPNTASQSLNLVVYDVLNKTGSTAYLVSWIDFNRDGDFNDAGERSQVTSLSPTDTLTNPVMQFNGFNTGCIVEAGLSYLRLRLTSDTTGGWNSAPSADGSRTNGEVEDYAITLMGADFGDAPAAYPVVRAMVNPDLNNDGSPDATGSVWLGNTVDYNYSCNYVPSIAASADDADNASNDEDGLLMSTQVPIGTPIPWTLTVNSQGPVTGAQWGMWIDWNADGTFDNFYANSVNTTGSPTAVTVNVTAPANAIQGFIVRVGTKAPGTPFAIGDYGSMINNGEWEDYIRATPLPVQLTYFNAAAKGCSAEVSWATAMEHNTDYFEIEQSINGTNWKVVKRIEAVGNSSSEKVYNTTIPLTSDINNYLRLKMVDRDGNQEYSMIRVLRCENRIPILIWPNPTTMKVQISGLPEGGTIQIFDVSGKEVIRMNDIAPTESISIENLPSAIYQVTILNKNGEKIEVQQLVKKN
jgi:hypothetical protein